MSEAASMVARCASAHRDERERRRAAGWWWQERNSETAWSVRNTGTVSTGCVRVVSPRTHPAQVNSALPDDKLRLGR